MTPMRGMLAEFIGTFALMFVGGGAIIMTAAMPSGGGGLVAVALAHGLILSVMVSAFMNVSGGQFNPAVSIALAVIGKQSWLQAMLFIIAQVISAVAAAALLKALLGELRVDGTSESAVMSVKVGATLGGMGLMAGSVFVLEAIATFFLMTVIVGTALDHRNVGRPSVVGGFGIGLTVAANILFFGPATGGSMNPARSFGPALVAGAWDMHWVYWLAPIVGAVAAAVIYKAAFGNGDAAR